MAILTCSLILVGIIYHVPFLPPPDLWVVLKFKNGSETPVSVRKVSINYLILLARKSALFHIATIGDPRTRDQDEIKTAYSQATGSYKHKFTKAGAHELLVREGMATLCLYFTGDPK